MSLALTRVNLIHRCKIRRLGAASLDDWGQPDVPSFEDLDADLPCRFWVQTGREPVDRDRTIVIKDYRMVVPLETDVTESDQVADVEHRGEIFAAGPFGIEAVLRHPDHLELMLQEIT